MNQQQIWDKIAPEWNEYKKTRNNLVDKFLKGRGKKKVLDLGCGSGRNFIKTNAEIYAVDFSKEMLKLAQQKADRLKINIHLVYAKSHKLPFKNNFFDSAIAVALLHCIKSKRKRQKTIKELYRVLKPKSQAFITVWNKTSRRLKNKLKKHKVSWTINGKKLLRDNYLYEYNELEGELKSVGFKIIKHFENQNNIMVVVGK